jgi:hypothetical protein
MPPLMARNSPRLVNHIEALPLLAVLVVVSFAQGAAVEHAIDLDARDALICLKDVPIAQPEIELVILCG